MPSHYLNQWWIIVSWNLRNIFQWNRNQMKPFSYKKMSLKVSSAIWHLFCLGPNVLRRIDCLWSYLFTANRTWKCNRSFITWQDLRHTDVIGVKWVLFPEIDNSTRLISLRTLTVDDVAHDSGSSPGRDGQNSWRDCAISMYWNNYATLRLSNGTRHLTLDPLS